MRFIDLSLFYKLKSFSSLLIFSLVGFYILSGTYIVGPDESAIITTFGKYSKSTNSGMHWYFPYPIGKVTKVKITKIYRVELGFKTLNNPNSYVDVLEESLMFTGDENIIDVEAIAQYNISDMNKYVFNLKEPEKMIKDAFEASIRQVVGYNTLEDILTVGKDKIQRDTKEILQKILDKYESGINVTAVQLQDVQPPDAVVAAFKDVASAKEDKIKYENQANGYVNDILPVARGEAQKIINEAIAYKEKRIKEAEGDVARFISLYERYKLGKEVTQKRLYLETMEKILPDIDKIIIDKDVKSSFLNMLNNNNIAEKGETKK